MTYLSIDAYVHHVDDKSIHITRKYVKMESSHCRSLMLNQALELDCWKLFRKLSGMSSCACRTQLYLRQNLRIISSSKTVGKSPSQRNYRKPERTLLVLIGIPGRVVRWPFPFPVSRLTSILCDILLPVTHYSLNLNRQRPYTLLSYYRSKRAKAEHTEH